MEELGKFSMQLQKHIDGGSQMCPFQKDFHDLAMRFRQFLSNTKPKLKLRDAGVYSRALPTRETPNGSMAGTPTPMSRMRPPPDASDIIDVSDDEDQPSPTLYRSGNKRAYQAKTESPKKLQRVESLPTQPSPVSIAQPKNFTLSEVRKIIQRGYISLPGQVDPKAIEELIRQSMQHWEKPVQEFFAQTKELCQNTVITQAQAAFGHRNQTGYFEKILNICEAFLEDALAEQLQIAQRVLSWELTKPKTLNEHAMYQARDEATILLRSQRRKVLAEPFLDELEEKSGKRSTGALRDEKLAKVPDNELVPETFGPELKAMAVSISDIFV